MNKERRKAIDALIKDAEHLQGAISDLMDQIEAIKDEEQEYQDNMPENLQGSEKYEAAQNAIDALDAARDALECVDFDDIIEHLNEAQS